MIAELDKYGLVVNIGNCHSVGYTGWSTQGGYGSLSASHGMGCGKALSALVILPSGEIVEGDKGMLFALNGGACGWGVVYETRIHVHKLKELLTGLIVFSLEQTAGILEGYQEILDG